MKDPVRLKVTSQVIHDGKLYLPGESSIVERDVAEEIAAGYPDAGATWTDFAEEKKAEDTRAAKVDREAKKRP